MRCEAGCVRGGFSIGFSPEASSIRLRDDSNCTIQRLWHHKTRAILALMRLNFLSVMVRISVGVGHRPGAPGNVLSVTCRARRRATGEGRTSAGDRNGKHL